MKLNLSLVTSTPTKKFQLDSLCPASSHKIAGVMGYLIEIDPLQSRIVFPQPDETSPFHPRAGKETKIPHEDSPSCDQEELRLEDENQAAIYAGDGI
jgi:hypothetical protein